MRIDHEHGVFEFDSRRDGDRIVSVVTHTPSPAFVAFLDFLAADIAAGVGIPAAMLQEMDYASRKLLVAPPAQ